MENKEKTNEEERFENRNWDAFGFGWSGMPKAMLKCFEGMRGSNDSGMMMCGCMKMCRYFPLFAIIFGIVFLLLGYYLDSEITRIIWMIFAGCVVIMGTFGLIMMRAMGKFRY